MTQQERKEQTKAAIEAVGILCFSERPFENVTMEEIAMRSRFTKRTVYNYYPTKASLIASIFERKLEELYDIEYKALSTCKTAREIIYAQTSVLNKFTKDNFRFMQMFWTLKNNINSGEVPDSILNHIVSLNRKLIDMPVSFLEKTELTGFLAAYSPEMIIHYISAINKGMFLQYDKDNALHLDGPKQEELTAFAMDCLLQCL